MLHVEELAIGAYYRPINHTVLMITSHGVFDIGS